MTFAPLVLEKTDFEALPETVQSWFKPNEEDGKFYINHPQESIEKLAVGLRKNRDDILEEKKTLKSELDPYKALGSIEEIQEKLEQAKRTPKAEEIKGQYETTIKEMKDQATQLETRHAKESAYLRSQIEKALIDEQARQAIEEHGGSVKLLLPALRDSLKLVETGEDDNRKFVVQVTGDDGTPRVADAFGTPLTISARVAELKKDEGYKRAFDPNPHAGGAGTPPRTGKPSVQQGAEMTSVQKIAAGLAQQQ